MRIIKNLFLGLAGLAILVFLFSLVFPRSIKVTRDVIINAPPAEIHHVIAHMMLWQKWYAAFTTAYQTKIILEKSEKIEWLDNSGRLSSAELVSQDSGFIEARIMSGNRHLLARFILNPLDSGRHTRVEWQTLVKLGWLPWEKFSGIFMEKLLAPAQEISLQNLKALAESGKE